MFHRVVFWVDASRAHVHESTSPRLFASVAAAPGPKTWQVWGGADDVGRGDPQTFAASNRADDAGLSCGCESRWRDFVRMVGAGVVQPRRGGGGTENAKRDAKRAICFPCNMGFPVGPLPGHRAFGMQPFPGEMQKARLSGGEQLAWCRGFVWHENFVACCLDVRTLTFCQLMGFPLSH